MKESLCRSVYIDILENMGDKTLWELLGSLFEVLDKQRDKQLDLPCRKQGMGREKDADGSRSSGAPLVLGHEAVEPVW